METTKTKRGPSINTILKARRPAFITFAGVEPIPAPRPAESHLCVQDGVRPGRKTSCDTCCQSMAVQKLDEVLELLTPVAIMGAQVEAAAARVTGFINGRKEGR